MIGGEATAAGVAGRIKLSRIGPSKPGPPGLDANTSRLQMTKRLNGSSFQRRWLKAVARESVTDHTATRRGAAPRAKAQKGKGESNKGRGLVDKAP